MRSARERLLEAADSLFYEEGVRAVGIDRIIARAGVAKASLYSTFGSKDELVRVYLTQRHERWKAHLEQSLAAGYPTPRERLLGVFDGLDTFFREPGFRGCSFMTAAAEAPAGGVIEKAADDFRLWLRGLFLDLAKQAGLVNAAALAHQLVVLYDGANVSAWMDHDPSAANIAKQIAAMVIEKAFKSNA
jgi:AcrR family transcriptional regulator